MSVASIPSVVHGDIPNKRKDDKSYFEKLRYLLTHITVEPLIFLATLPYVMNLLTTQNLYLEKACRVTIRYNNSICDAMSKRDYSQFDLYQEEEVQKEVSNMVAIKMAVLGSYPAFLMLFIGSWSDRHGRRKPIILMPVIGDLVASILLLICSYFFMEISLEYTLMADVIPTALGATWACGYLGIYTYVSGLCTDEDRTIRIGTVTMFQNISGTLGIFCSGILINLLGFKGVYTTSATMISTALIYGIFMIKEQPLKNMNKKKVGCFQDFFSLGNVMNTFKICFKEGPNNRKKRVLVMMFLSAMIMGPYNGESSVAYLYTRIKLGWNEVDFSLFNSVHSVIQIGGGLFALAFFTKYLKIDDGMLGVIALTSRISGCLIYAFAPNGTVFYLGSLVEVFNGTCHIALRSLMAKIVPPHELGQSNSVFGIFESVTPLLFGPIYLKLYKATISFFPGMFYLFTAGLYMITWCLFFWMYLENRRDKIKSSQVKDEMQAVKLLN